MMNFFAQLSRSSPSRKPSANVQALLLKFCRSKATGIDNISAKLLREYPDLIAVSHIYLVNPC